MHLVRNTLLSCPVTMLRTDGRVAEQTEPWWLLDPRYQHSATFRTASTKHEDSSCNNSTLAYLLNTNCLTLLALRCPDLETYYLLLVVSQYSDYFVPLFREWKCHSALVNV